MEKSALNRIKYSIKEVWPKALKTCLWLVRITVLVTFGVQLLEYFGILPVISGILGPLFNLMGLPGEAALAWVTGFFVNVYAAIAVISTLNLDVRMVTILSVMVLCAHNMITETAVQKKTGSSAIRIFTVRTLSAFVLGFALNLIMPEMSGKIAVETGAAYTTFWEMMQIWGVKTLRLVLLMSTLIIFLTFLQRVLAEFGVIRWLSKLFKPVMVFFGLPPKTSFLWIVANTLGLAYGAAVMIDETESGKITREDANLLNHHIAISHSNLEDVILLTSVGAIVWWLLLARWLFSFILVWELRLEMALKKKFLPLQVK